MSSANWPENYILADDSWKYDKMPEFYNGKNVADFIDPDIAEKLEALEREEEALEAQGFYASDPEEMVSDIGLKIAELRLMCRSIRTRRSSWRPRSRSEARRLR